PPPIAANPIANASAIHTAAGIVLMNRATTVPGELAGGTTIVCSRWPGCVNVVARAAGLPAGAMAAAVPDASGVVRGLAANVLGATVVAAERAPPPSLEPELATRI